jgi:hypothetical protein
VLPQSTTQNAATGSHVRSIENVVKHLQDKPLQDERLKEGTYVVAPASQPPLQALVLLPPVLLPKTSYGGTLTYCYGALNMGATLNLTTLTLIVGRFIKLLA